MTVESPWETVELAPPPTGVGAGPVRRGYEPSRSVCISHTRISAGVVAVTVVLYSSFTYKASEWRISIRREMNDSDTEASSKAVDSLLNYETVKYFGAERWERTRYDRSVARYESATVKTEKRVMSCPTAGRPRSTRKSSDARRRSLNSSSFQGRNHSAWMNG